MASSALASWDVHSGPSSPAAVYNNTTLSGSGLGIGWTLQAGTTSAITGARFRYGARTGTPPSYVLTAETLDSSGNPSGTDIGGASPTAKVFTPPASTAWDSTYQTVTFTNSWTPSAVSDKVAITIRYSSGTVNASNCSSFSLHGSTFFAAARAFPHTSTLSAGTWTKGSNGGAVLSLQTASTVIGSPMKTAYLTLTANTAGHRSAGYFTIPSTMGTTFRIIGFIVSGTFGAAAGTTLFKLWDSSWNALASCTMDADLFYSIGNSGTQARILFDSPYTASFGTKYYIGMEVSSGAVGVTGIQVNAADEMACYPNGSNMGLVTYNGSTTETSTIYPMITILTDDITVPSGSGLALPVVRGMI